MLAARPTALEGVVEFQPHRFADDRGWFSESWNRSAMADLGTEIDWVQDNESFSKVPGTVRGLHLQTAPFAQAKLIRCVQGAIFDVAVDLRTDSATYKHWVGVTLSSDTGNQLLVPVGFGHGFCTQAPDCLVQYKVSAPYSAASDLSIAWNDPELAINWPLADLAVTLSAKDANAPLLRDIGPIDFGSAL